MCNVPTLLSHSIKEIKIKRDCVYFLGSTNPCVWPSAGSLTAECYQSDDRREESE